MINAFAFAHTFVALKKKFASNDLWKENASSMTLGGTTQIFFNSTTMDGVKE